MAYDYSTQSVIWRLPTTKTDVLSERTRAHEPLSIPKLIRASAILLAPIHPHLICLTRTSAFLATGLLGLERIIVLEGCMACAFPIDWPKTELVELVLIWSVQPACV